MIYQLTIIRLALEEYVKKRCSYKSKISSKVDESAWNDLKQLAQESHQNISGILTDAIKDYVHKRRVRPVVLQHLEDSIRDNEALGHLLAK